MLVYVHCMFLLHIKCSNVFMITKLHFNRIIIYTALQSKKHRFDRKNVTFLFLRKMLYNLW